MRLHGNPTAWYLFLATDRGQNYLDCSVEDEIDLVVWVKEIDLLLVNCVSAENHLFLG